MTFVGQFGGGGEVVVVCYTTTISLQHFTLPPPQPMMTADTE